MENREGKRRYKETFDIVREITLREDWGGLIASGARLNEYDSEIVLIVALLSKRLTVSELAAGIEEIFLERMGGKPGFAHVYERGAEEILRRSTV